VFYALFCAWGLLGFTPWIGWAAMALSALFGYAVLSPDLTLSAQWENWINPATQALSFLAGALIVPRLTPSWLWPVLWVLLCLVLPTPFAAYWVRPLIVVAGCGVVATLSRIKSSMDLIGKYSYQIYLFHPVFWFAIF
jgi:hypothetical protein